MQSTLLMVHNEPSSSRCAATPCEQTHMMHRVMARKQDQHYVCRLTGTADMCSLHSCLSQRQHHMCSALLTRALAGLQHECHHAEEEASHVSSRSSSTLHDKGSG